ncbi:mitochondrial ribosomal protein L27-domain-containing protein [Chaetomium sp. MPI-SDFR-AT-0129]|uniref:Mitochondrial ribosomal protein L27-domain-containing protein n=1 Tax=Dichotomopilus funicola TaxID=1934379 RepID=A0AAN6VA41_9PEZI|nr:mitochondrial ribosomal protein L27-domain-containing protein [Chaetomium sp. MPI-SDFR-AT-0129]KAK4147522.1 mitochondrial ribosomal protein L27-domain-containing protein [Dichotomopilus funicola]
MQPTRALQVLRYRRLRLTTKDVNKGYYKGTGSGSMGRHTKHGGYIIEWNKVRTYVCPPLDGFKLTPFVTATMPRTYGKYDTKLGPKDATMYLERWKAENGLD